LLRRLLAAAGLLEVVENAASEVAGRKVHRKVDRGGEARGVGAAMALHRDAVEAEENAAVVVARIHPLAHRLERAAGEHVAELGAPRALERLPEDLRVKLRRAFGRLQRDVA